MKPKWFIAALAVLLASPVWLAGQETPRPSRPARPSRAPRAERSLSVFGFSDNRGRIGVVVNSAADPVTDKIGARLEAITPGGPAGKAGLKAGDIITKFSGTSLAGLKAEDEDESGPGMKLVELARALEPGDTVQLEYRRGSETKKATLVAEDLGWTMGRIQIPPNPPRPLVALPQMLQDFEFSFGYEPWGDLELVTLNPDLGEYFGTREGLLVVKAPADSALPLKSGDVIVSIGGRKPTSPSHAMRILRSYDEGESVTLDVIRKQKRTTVTWKVPEREERSPYRRWRNRDSDPS